MPDVKEDREEQIAMLQHAFTHPATITRLPPPHNPDAQIDTVVEALTAFTQEDPPTAYHRLFDWGTRHGWDYYDLLAAVRYIGQLRQESAREAFTRAAGSSDRYDWPDRPIVRAKDGTPVPLGAIPVGWLMLTDKRMPHGALRLYLVLWFYAKRMDDGTWRAQVQLPRLIEHLSVGEGTAVNTTLSGWLRKLEAAGYLEDPERCNGKTRKGRNLPKVYILKVNPDGIPIFDTPKGVGKALLS